MKILSSAALSAVVLFSLQPAFAQTATTAAPAATPATATAADATAKKSPFSSAGITADRKGQIVNIAGTVEGFQAARSDRAPSSFTLRDSAGTIRVAIWKDAFDKIAGKEQLKDGALVEVKAEIALFKEKPELHVNDAADIRFLKPGDIPPAASVSPAAAKPGDGAASASAATAAAPVVAAQAGAPLSTTGAPAAATAPGGITPIAQLTKDKVGQTFSVTGKVESARKPSNDRAPYVLKVTDASGSIDVVFWSDLAAQFAEGQKVNQGDQAQFTGKLSEHRNNLQLQLSDKSAVKTAKTDPALFSAPAAAPAAATPQAAGKKLSLEQLASAALGERVQVEGRVKRVEPIRTGRKVTLENGSTEASVLLWDTAEGLVPSVSTLKQKDSVTFAGKVDRAGDMSVLVVSRPEEVLSITQ